MWHVLSVALKGGHLGRLCCNFIPLPHGENRDVYLSKLLWKLDCLIFGMLCDRTSNQRSWFMFVLNHSTFPTKKPSLSIHLAGNGKRFIINTLFNVHPIAECALIISFVKCELPLFHRHWWPCFCSVGCFFVWSALLQLLSLTSPA